MLSLILSAGYLTVLTWTSTRSREACCVGMKKRVEYGSGGSGVTSRLHDLRPSFCTELGESGAADSVMLDMMGGVSPAMMRADSHIRGEARGSDFRAGKAAFRRIAVKCPPNRSATPESSVSH